MSEQAAEAKGALGTFDKTGNAPHILFPPKDAELWSGDVNGKPARPFVLAGRGDGKLRWYIDGEPTEVDDAGLPIWAPQQSGFYVVSAVDGSGREASVRVRVIGAPSG